jgi:hypothetical protein
MDSCIINIDDSRLIQKHITGYFNNKSNLFSVISFNDNLLKRVVGGLFDIARAIANAVMAPFRMFLLGNGQKVVFDLLNLPITVIRSIACLSGSNSVANAFERFQGNLAMALINYYIPRN